MTLKDKFFEGDSSIHRFNNIFIFMNFCYINKLTPENSETYYDVENYTMYITRIINT